MKKINMTFKIGEKVRYSHAFLNSISANYETANLTGIVKEIKEYPQIKKVIIKVLWQGETEETGCLSSNLAHMNYDITE
jgi:hypothetical protein